MSTPTATRTSSPAATPAQVLQLSLAPGQPVSPEGYTGHVQTGLELQLVPLLVTLDDQARRGDARAQSAARLLRDGQQYLAGLLDQAAAVLIDAGREL